MKARATITLEPEILEKTRGLARRRRTNVSSLIEQLLDRELNTSSGLAKKLVGSAELRERPGDVRYERLLKKHLHE